MKRRTDEEVRQVIRERSQQGGPDECWPWVGSTISGGYGCLSYQSRSRTAHQVVWILENGPMPSEIEGKRPCIMHTCDNPPCVNPAHLKLGTYADNMKDKWAKGRGYVPSGDDHYARTNPEKLARGDRNGARTRPDRLARGERHGSRTKPWALARGEDHWTARHPEKIRRGFKMPSGSVCRGERSGTAKLTDEKVLRIREAYAEGGCTLTAFAKEHGVSVSALSRLLLGQTWAHVGGPLKEKHQRGRRKG